MDRQREATEAANAHGVEVRALRAQLAAAQAEAEAAAAAAQERAQRELLLVSAELEALQAQRREEVSAAAAAAVGLTSCSLRYGRRARARFLPQRWAQPPRTAARHPCIGLREWCCQDL